MKKKKKLLFITILIPFLLLGCNEKTKTNDKALQREPFLGKWQLFYFGELPVNQKEAVVYYKDGIPRDSYMELKKDGTLSYFSKINGSADGGLWRVLNGTLIFIFPDGKRYTEKIHSITKKRLFTSYNDKYYFGWQKIQ